MTGTLFLSPVALGGDDPRPLLPAATRETLCRLRHFVVEDARSARRFLKALGHPVPLQCLHLATLNEHTRPRDIAALLAPALRGADCALLSEAGCPAVADPGAALVSAAHAHGVRVVPLVGPSAILLALMASGLNGQRFVFHGYLPVAAAARRAAIVELERASRARDATQIFIEAPYRNRALLDAVLEACGGGTRLCLATDLTLPGETVITRPIEQWRREPPAIDRRPTVFLLYRGAS
jgi:16S rRNA (cytidine1402-2'-O)-methyltransferase